MLSRRLVFGDGIRHSSERAKKRKWKHDTSQKQNSAEHRASHDVSIYTYISYIHMYIYVYCIICMYMIKRLLLKCSLAMRYRLIAGMCHLGSVG